MLFAQYTCCCFWHPLETICNPSLSTDSFRRFYFKRKNKVKIYEQKFQLLSLFWINLGGKGHLAIFTMLKITLKFYHEYCFKKEIEISKYQLFNLIESLTSARFKPMAHGPRISSFTFDWALQKDVVSNCLTSPS